MFNFKYTTPKETDKGRHTNETISKSSVHTFKDTNRDVISDELSKLNANYPDYDINVSVAFKLHKSSK